MKTIIIWTAAFVVMAALAFAGVPQTINYQGYLKDGKTGEPIWKPTDMTFSLYSTTNGANAVWTSHKPGNPRVNVTPVNGVYNVELGADSQQALPAFDRKYWLGVQAESEPEMRPLQPLSSVPYALRADIADSAATVAGQGLTELDNRYIDPTRPAPPTPLQIATLRWDQAGRSGTFPVGAFPVGVAFDGANVWVTSMDTDTVKKVRTSDGAVLGSYATGDGPYEVAFDGANIWVANTFSNNVTKLRASDGATLGTYTVGNNPKGIAFDGTNVWVANSNSGTVTKLRASDGLLQGVYPVGTTPIHITFDGSNVWVSNFSSNNVTKLRASDGAVLKTTTVGINPWMSAFDGTNIWVANSGSNAVTQIRASDGVPYYNSAAGVYPVAVVFDGINIWVSNKTSANVYKIRPSDGATLHIYPMGSEVYGLAFDGAYIWAVLNTTGQVAKLPITSESSPAYVADGSITSDKIFANAVTTGHIANGAVTTAKIGAGAVTTTSIADSSVTSAKISGTIAPAKLDLSTVVSKTGDTITGNLGVTGDLILSTSSTIFAGAGTLVRVSGVNNFFAGALSGNIASTGGGYNTASGAKSLQFLTSGYHNTASGYSALGSNTDGYYNTAFGAFAGNTISTGSHNNTFLGNNSGVSAPASAYLDNATAIGSSAIVDASNHVRIGNTLVTQVGGQVAWSNLSDIRQKKDIADVAYGLDFIKALRPVEYRMKEGNGRKDFGFIAQEVETLLGTEYNVLGIGGDADRTLTLRYTDFIAPLVKAVQEQQVLISNQQTTIDQLKTELAEIRKLIGR